MSTFWSPLPAGKRKNIRQKERKKTFLNIIFSRHLRSLKHFDTGKLFSNLRHVVLDEADALLDGGNRKSIHDVLRVVNELQTERTKEKSDIPLQFVFSAATLPATAVKSPLAFIQEVTLPRSPFKIPNRSRNHPVLTSNK